MKKFLNTLENVIKKILLVAIYAFGTMMLVIDMHEAGYSPLKIAVVFVCLVFIIGWAIAINALFYDPCYDGNGDEIELDDHEKELSGEVEVLF